MKISIRVPVKPYVKNFIISYCGLDPIPLNTRNCLICDKLNDLLSRPSRLLYKGQTPESLNKCTEKVSFIVPSNQVRRGGFDLSPDKVIHFNNFIDKLIRDRLFILLDSMLALQPKTNIHQTIRNYLSEYGLEEAGLPFRTLLKSYERYRSAKAPIVSVQIMAFKEREPAERLQVQNLI